MTLNREEPDEICHRLVTNCATAALDQVTALLPKFAMRPTGAAQLANVTDGTTGVCLYAHEENLIITSLSPIARLLSQPAMRSKCVLRNAGVVKSL